MVGHGTKFGRKKEQAIAALLIHGNVGEAARTTGIGVNTLARWMKEPEFQTAYREARRTAFSRTMGQLQEFSGAAAKTAVKIMLDSKVAPGTRLRAAEMVLNLAIKAVELETALERPVGQPSAPKPADSQGSATVTWPSQKALPSPAADTGGDDGD